MDKVLSLRKLHSLPKIVQNKALIDGKWHSTPSTFSVANPATNEIITEVSDCGVEAARLAIAAAKQAFPSWAALPSKERSKALRRFFDLHMKYKEDLARIMTLEMGKPLIESRGEIDYGASFLEWFSEEARRIYGEIISMPTPTKQGEVFRQPMGVAGIITPWNFPNAMITRKIGAALAAGCTCVVKPAEDTPLSALAIGQLALEAEIPPGVLNIIPASRSNSVSIGKEFCENPNVSTISFTGSTSVGKTLLSQAAGNIKRVSLELGGNAPFLVFNSADVDAAVKGILACKFRNAGQTCVSANRILVQDQIYEAILEKLTSAMATQLKVGNGMEEGVTIGPLINEQAVRKVERHVNDAVSKGAKLLVGGRSPGGNFFEPTLIADLPKTALVCQEETFGPVACIQRFTTEEEGLALANSTQAGLAGYFFSRDLDQINRVKLALEVGMVGVNEGLISAAEAPFGGVKQSGIGREGSHHGIDEYVNIKYVCHHVNP